MTQLFMTHPGPLPGRGEVVGIRRASADDAAGLAELLTATFEEAWTTDRVRAELLEAPDVPVTWVLPGGQGAIAATASERLLPQQYPGAGYLHYVAVAAGERGRGLGVALTLTALAGFTERGLHTAVLETDDFRRSAVVIYLRLGFVPTYRNGAEITAWSQLFPELLTARTVRA